MREKFLIIAENASQAVGSSWAFVLALSVVVIWFLSGSLYHYSDTWQLIINTGTTIVTFLMVFLIQNTQNRETRIMMLKLDELLRGVRGARTSFVELDQLSEEDLEAVHAEFHRLGAKYRSLLEDDIASVDDELKNRQKRRMPT